MPEATKKQEPQQRALESEMQAATGDAEGAEDPSQRVQETATCNGEKASSTETTRAKDTAEQESQTREETHMQTGAA